MSDVDIQKRVDQFVQLRDLIRQRDDAHKKDMSPLRETLEKLNAVLLNYLNDLNMNSASTSAGTVYRTEKKSASIADAEAFMKHIITNGAFDLLDRKANVTAVTDYIETNGTPPPGVNYSKTYVVGVRRK